MPTPEAELPLLRWPPYGGTALRTGVVEKINLVDYLGAPVLIILDRGDGKRTEVVVTNLDTGEVRTCYVPGELRILDPYPPFKLEKGRPFEASFGPPPASEVDAEFRLVRATVASDQPGTTAPWFGVKAQFLARNDVLLAEIPLEPPVPPPPRAADLKAQLVGAAIEYLDAPGGHVLQWVRIPFGLEGEKLRVDDKGNVEFFVGGLSWAPNIPPYAVGGAQIRFKDGTIKPLRYKPSPEFLDRGIGEVFFETL